MATMDKVVLSFSMKNCEKDCIYEIKLMNKDESLGNCREFKTSQKQCHYENENIKFNESILFNYYFDKKQIIEILIIVYPANPKEVFEQYSRKTTLSSLIGSPNFKYERTINPKHPDKNIISIEVKKKNFGNNNQITIFDYISAGVKLSTFIALDFSQGKNKESLSESLKNYKTFLNEIVIDLYNYKDTFFIYGYGATLRNLKNFNVLYKYTFNLNQTDDEPIKSNKILHIYNDSIKCINPEKKVFISSLIRKISKKIFEIYELRYYNILFILSRELTAEEDIQELKDALIESSYLPLSIIIIYEGKNDFSKMELLFGENQTRNRIIKRRNNIIPVPLQDQLEKNYQIIIEKSLRQIALQMIEFYNLNLCTPEHIRKENIKNISDSFNIYQSTFSKYEMRMSQISIAVDNKDQNILNMFQNNNDSQKNLSQLSSDKSNDYKKNNNNKNNIIQQNQSETPNPKSQVYFIPYSGINPKYVDNPYNNQNNNNNYKKNDFTNNNNSNYQNKNANYQNNNVNNNYQNNYANNSNSFRLLNSGISNNNATNLKNNDSKLINLNQKNEKSYIITPGSSIVKSKENPWNTKNKYIITPGDSKVIRNMENPYKKEAEKETPKGQYFIPQQSINESNNINNNPYNGYSGQKKEVNNSQSFGVMSTNESNNNYTRINNYSIDANNQK